jgi:hypothetical protein
MTIISAYLGEAVHHLKSGRSLRFRPQGEILIVNAEGVGVASTARTQTNPLERIGSGGYASRIFVGLSVGDTPKYTIDDVVAETWRVRKEQERAADASFLAQRGLYDDLKTGDTVFETSVQIVIIDMIGQQKEAFVKEMTALAEDLRKKFEQQSVILEIQHRGISEDVYSVT